MTEELTKSKFVKIVDLQDPDTGNKVSLEIRKLETGQLVGLDASYLENVAAGEQPNNPYSDGKFEVPDDEERADMPKWYLMTMARVPTNYSPHFRVLIEARDEQHAHERRRLLFDDETVQVHGYSTKELEQHNPELNDLRHSCRNIYPL